MYPLDLDNRRSNCPAAAALDLIGDRWTLLVIRDLLLHDQHRYGEFLAMDEPITTSVLADRLKRLEAVGIVDKRLYQEHPPRYEYHLTERGRDLDPVLHSLIEWGLKHISGTGKNQPPSS